jgi:hypothetical protein
MYVTLFLYCHAKYLLHPTHVCTPCQTTTAARTGRGYDRSGGYGGYDRGGYGGGRWARPGRTEPR